MAKAFNIVRMHRSDGTYVHYPHLKDVGNDYLDATVIDGKNDIIRYEIIFRDLLPYEMSVCMILLNQEIEPKHLEQVLQAVRIFDAEPVDPKEVERAIRCSNFTDFQATQ